jgi:cytoskeletal protein CcmA (bactofilin family)
VALFKREPKFDPASSIPAAPFESVKEKPMAIPKKETAVSLKTDDITTILGRGSEFEGKLHFEGTLRIDGSFSGEIRSDSVLVIGEGAKINAEVDIGSIIVNGEVRGNVRAKTSVEIRHPGRLLGNIQTPALIIEKGVVFEGTCKMENLGQASPQAFHPADKPKKADDKSLI